MKIAKAIRDAYFENEPHYKRLSTEIRQLIKRRVEEKGWFYYARVKGLESFALKVETGRVSKPSRMEDFFACTIVVPTIEEIKDAESFTRSQFDVISRRPKDDVNTHKRSSSFQFDDLRMYVCRKAPASRPLGALEGRVFEVQIKSILQHAWSQATHDLVYKSGTIRWSLERIAFQIKAMLEHAEVAIASADTLAITDAVSKEDDRTREIAILIQCFRKIWPDDSLPVDVRRLAETIREILLTCKLKAESLEALIESEETRLGTLPLDLSPYAFTVQALAWNSDAKLQDRIGRGSWRRAIVIHKDMDLPEWMKRHNPCILRVGKF